MAIHLERKYRLIMLLGGGVLIVYGIGMYILNRTADWFGAHRDILQVKVVASPTPTPQISYPAPVPVSNSPQPVPVQTLAGSVPVAAASANAAPANTVPVNALPENASPRLSIFNPQAVKDAANLAVVPEWIQLGNSETRIGFLAEGEGVESRLCPGDKESAFLIDPDGTRHRLLSDSMAYPGANQGMPQCQSIAPGERVEFTLSFEGVKQDASSLTLFWNSRQRYLPLQKLVLVWQPNELWQQKSSNARHLKIAGPPSTLLLQNGMEISVESVDLRLGETAVTYKVRGSESSQISLCHIDSGSSGYFLTDDTGRRYELLFDLSPNGCRQIVAGEVSRVVHLYQKLPPETGSIKATWNDGINSTVLYLQFTPDSWW